MDPITRFKSYLSEPDSNGCILWNGGTSSAGYGYYMFNNKNWRVHRLNYMLVNGSIDDRLVIRHLCNNKLCVNINHLMQGTPKENIEDQIKAGTFVYGERNGRAKLTPEAVIDIRTSGELLRVYSERYGVSMALVSRVRLGKSWRHI